MMNNKYVVYEEYVAIIVNHKGEVLEVLIDHEDLEVVQRATSGVWRMHEGGYIRSNTQDSINIHNAIMGKPEGNNVVDHINRNRLDNRRCNLRVVSQGVNARNGSIRRNNTSGYIGVSYVKHLNKWKAQVRVDYKMKYLGVYEDKMDAVRAVMKGQLHYWGFTVLPRTPITLPLKEASSYVDPLPDL